MESNACTYVSSSLAVAPTPFDSTTTADCFSEVWICDRSNPIAVCLPVRFFDLKSGEAGEILQKYRNYGVRLAVIGGLAEAAANARFSEAMIEENRQQHFRLFAEREQAIAWLAGDAGQP